LISPSTNTSSRAELAQLILDNPNIELHRYSPVDSSDSDGADALSNIKNTAASKAAQRSSYDGAPGGGVDLDSRLLEGMLALATEFSFRISSVAGGYTVTTPTIILGAPLMSTRSTVNP
jgi:zinc D-Ala-D-Ala carboxypeptidase